MEVWEVGGVLGVRRMRVCGCLACRGNQQSHTAARAINASGDANAFIH